jgi:hypothetical protein
VHTLNHITFNTPLFPIINHSLKIILNSSFGLGNSEYSFVYDTKATLGTTVNGMLTLTMGVDMLQNKLSYFYPLQYNTDGLTFMMLKSEFDIAKNVFDNLTKIDNIPYEYTEYSKMVIIDVNNYLAIYPSGQLKTKGIFEDYNDIINSKSYHKDTSAMIIPKALKKYFVDNIPVEETIENENSIYEFCYGNKGSSSYSWLLTTYNDVKNIATSELFDSRFVRYYAGGNQTLSQLWVLGKKKGVIQAVQAQTPITMLMNVPKEDIFDFKKGERIYKLKERYSELNKNWYIEQCYDIINKILLKSIK